TRPPLGSDGETPDGEPGDPAAAAPDVARQSEAGESEARQSEAAQSEAAQSEAAQSEGRQPDPAMVAIKETFARLAEAGDDATAYFYGSLFSKRPPLRGPVPAG